QQPRVSASDAANGGSWWQDPPVEKSRRAAHARGIGTLSASSKGYSVTLEITQTSAHDQYSLTGSMLFTIG
ncbi:MAG: hypothetical protein HYV03_03115, partial [Deltaproteobacteria bacterium]|nr:hypothetical protein [Deltaproteobacteria bacterium]